MIHFLKLFYRVMNKYVCIALIIIQITFFGIILNFLEIHNLFNYYRHVLQFDETDERFHKVKYFTNTDKIHVFGSHKCLIQNGCQLYLSDVPYFMNKSLIIAGLAKNVEDHIKNLLFQMDEIACIFQNTVFIIFESNSKDETLNIFNQWLMFDGLANTSSMDSSINLSSTIGYYKQFCSKMKYNPISRNMNYESIEQNNLLYYQQNLTFNINDSNVNRIKKQMSNFRPENVFKYILDLEIDEKVYHLKSRISIYIYLRNILLQEINSLIKEKHSNIDWNYLMLVDWDIPEFDSKMFFNELFDLQQLQSNVQTKKETETKMKSMDNETMDNSTFLVDYGTEIILCVNGWIGLNLMRDTFATVLENGKWMFSYGLIPDLPFYNIYNFPTEKFLKVKSCFGGMASFVIYILTFLEIMFLQYIQILRNCFILNVFIIIWKQC